MKIGTEFKFLTELLSHPKNQIFEGKNRATTNHFKILNRNPATGICGPFQYRLFHTIYPDNIRVREIAACLFMQQDTCWCEKTAGVKKILGENC
ncbi:hypothetical protein [Methanosarcina sp. MTP4]|uniref:hypothetical protein n=1 Tax=Methanosarcina sp. MTP4 TaxID=1434100 RepID=UPI00064F511C|nr:hypothetical protein [Methanosarcina sp. MTP4]